MVPSKRAVYHKISNELGRCFDFMYLSESYLVHAFPSIGITAGWGLVRKQPRALRYMASTLIPAFTYKAGNLLARMIG